MGLTPEVKDLSDRLYRGTIEGKRHRASALRQIGELGTPAAIPRLAAFLDSTKRREAAEALKAIAYLLIGYGPRTCVARTSRSVARRRIGVRQTRPEGCPLPS
jgi:HEAT repeat protein